MSRAKRYRKHRRLVKVARILMRRSKTSTKYNTLVANHPVYRRWLKKFPVVKGWRLCYSK